MADPKVEALKYDPQVEIPRRIADSRKKIERAAVFTEALHPSEGSRQNQTVADLQARGILPIDASHTPKATQDLVNEAIFRARDLARVAEANSMLQGIANESPFSTRLMLGAWAASGDIFAARWVNYLGETTKRYVAEKKISDSNVNHFNIQGIDPLVVI